MRILFRFPEKGKKIKDDSNFFLEYLLYSAITFSAIFPNLVLQKMWLTPCQALVKGKHVRNNQSAL